MTISWPVAVCTYSVGLITQVVVGVTWSLATKVWVDSIVTVSVEAGWYFCSSALWLWSSVAHWFSGLTHLETCLKWRALFECLTSHPSLGQLYFLTPWSLPEWMASAWRVRNLSGHSSHVKGKLTSTLGLASQVFFRCLLSSPLDEKALPQSHLKAFQLAVLTPPHCL